MNFFEVNSYYSFQYKCMFHQPQQLQYVTLSLQTKLLQMLLDYSLHHLCQYEATQDIWAQM